MTGARSRATGQPAALPGRPARPGSRVKLKSWTSLAGTLVDGGSDTSIRMKPAWPAPASIRAPTERDMSAAPAASRVPRTLPVAGSTVSTRVTVIAADVEFVSRNS